MADDTDNVPAGYEDFTDVPAEDLETVTVTAATKPSWLWIVAMIGVVWWMAHENK